MKKQSLILIASCFLAVNLAAQERATVRGGMSDIRRFDFADGRRGLAVSLFSEGKIDFIAPRDQGFAGPLRAEFYAGKQFEELKLTRQDSQIDFAWGYEAAANSVPADKFSVRWTGQLRVERGGEYVFYTQTDDGVRLTVDGKLVVDRWQDMGTTEFSGKINLTPGRAYDIKMEYYDAGGAAEARLLWSGPGQSKSVIGAIGQLAQGGSLIDLERPPLRMAIADFNGDQKQDIAVLHSGFPGAVTVCLQTLDGFDQLPAIAVGMDPNAIAAGDIDGDGKMDIIVGNSASKDVRLIKRTADGTWQSSTFNTGSSTGDIALLPRKDGKSDIAIALPGKKSVLILGPGLEEKVRLATTDSARTLVSGDFNNDGMADLAAFDQNGQMYFWVGRNNGPGAVETFASGVAVAALPASAGILILDEAGNLSLLKRTTAWSKSSRHELGKGANRIVRLANGIAICEPLRGTIAMIKGE